jgi:hypothetical protein
MHAFLQKPSTISLALVDVLQPLLGFPSARVLDPHAYLLSAASLLM